MKQENQEPSDFAPGVIEFMLFFRCNKQANKRLKTNLINYEN